MSLIKKRRRGEGRKAIYKVLVHRPQKHRLLPAPLGVSWGSSIHTTPTPADHTHTQTDTHTAEALNSSPQGCKGNPSGQGLLWSQSPMCPLPWEPCLCSHSAHKTSSVPSKRQNLHPFKKREKLVYPARAGQVKGFESVTLGLEHDCGQTQSTRTTVLDGCKEHPSVEARASLQVPRGMLPASTGLQIPTLGKTKTQSSPACDQSLAGQHGHSQPPPLPQPLWVLHPACFGRKKGTGAS